VKLSPMVPKSRRTGRVAKRHSVEGHGELTAAEIATLAGIGVEAARRRVQQGRPAREVLAPKHALVNKRGSSGYSFMEQVFATGHCTMTVAVRIARAFPHDAPSVAWLRCTFGMSRSTAYRWRRAWLDELEREAARGGKARLNG
jgi:hypothetical protein